jgi:glycine cleavage system H protein
MDTPEELQYTKEHEWLSIEGDVATIGITDFAQQELGDVVYVELPDEGETFEEGESFGSVESVKAVSEIYMPLSGTVTEVNEVLADSPEEVNNSPYGDGWMIRIKIADESRIDLLLSSDEYITYVEEESE